MTSIRSIFRRFQRSTDGATAVEYGLIVAAISITLLASLTLVGNGVSDTFTTVGGSLSSSQSN